MSKREQILKCLGSFPEKCELNKEITDKQDKEGYIQYRVCYNVEKDERVEAFLLLPKELKDKNPAVIACHQHKGEYFLGKSEPAGLSANVMFHYGKELCLRGYVVLCPDHLAFEDRRPAEYRRMENKAVDGGSYERFLFCKYISSGSTLQAKYLSDLTRGVDLLCELDYTDKDRIGTIGHSLGGQEALWLSWYDERIKVGVSSCGFSQIGSILREEINHNFAMFSFGILENGDISAVVTDMAPKPFLMTNGLKDRIFPVDGVLKIASAAKEKYGSTGDENKFESILFDDGHSFPDDVKKRAYEWIDRFLK